MNANNNSQQRKSKIPYKGAILDPGNRSGKTRQNWIKRQKSRIRTGNAQSTGGVQRRSPNQNSQFNSRSSFRNSTNQQTSAGGQSQAMRNSRELSSVSSKIGVNQLGAYLGAVLDPFNAPQGARTPSEVPFPSAAVTMNFTGLITPNASGNFGLILQPQAGLAGQWREFVATLTNADFTSANAFLQAAGSVATGLRTNYLPAGIALRFRIVGAGIKCWYVGKEQDRAGYYASAFIPKAAIKNAGLDTIVGGYTEDQLREAQYSTSCSVKATPEVIWVPRDDIDYDYMAIDAMRESSVCVIQGFGLPSTACIKWEAVIHAEYIPDPTAANARLLSTGISVASKADASAILGVLTQNNPGYVASPDNGKNLFSDFSEGVSEFLSESIGNISKVARSYLSDIAMDVSSDLFASGMGVMSKSVLW